MRDLFERDPQAIVWWGTELECLSALMRRRRADEITEGSARHAYQRLERFARGWVTIDASPTVKRHATRLLRTHPLRTGDALQLAAAVVGCGGDPETMPFVCLDERLLDAAEVEGFRVLSG